MLPLEMQLFLQVKRALDKHNVDVIYGSEVFLYSDKVKAAGACDLLCRMNGFKTVADFKTSRRAKKEEDILGYFIQTAAYAWMVYERTGIVFPKLAVIIGNDSDREASVFIKDSKDYIPKMKKMFDDFQKLKG